MDHEPYAPPQAVLEDAPPSSTGEVIPFEDKAAFPGLGQRILETCRWILADRERAGAALRGTDALGQPLVFLLLVAFLPTVLPGLLGVFFPRTPFWMTWMHAPQATPAQGIFLVVAAVGVLVFAPVGLIIGTLVGGLLYHAGLWMVRGTTGRFGLAATLRSVAYTAAALSWIIFPFHLGQSLPGLAGQLFLVLAFLLTFFGSTTYQGVLLARTHQVETWRGVAGAWILNVVILGCLAACFGLIFWFAGDSIREALRHAGGG